MNRKTLLVASAALILFVLTSAGLYCEPFKPGFRGTGTLGYVSVGDQTYTQIRLMPELSWWKFGLGLDLDFLIDENGNVRKEDWNDLSDIITKIYYIRYGREGDNFYAMAGGFPSYTLGQGLIMKGYTNMLMYPEFRNVGLMLGYNLPVNMNPGGEVFTSNVTENEILAGRIHFQPLIDSEIKIVENVTVGASAAVDRNQFGRYPDLVTDFDADGIPNSSDIDMDGDGLLDSPDVNPYVDSLIPNLPDSIAAYLDNYIKKPDLYGNKNDFLIYSVDYDLPLLLTDFITVGHYAEFAQIDDYGTGLIFPGFYTTFLMFKTNLEFRRFSSEFLPGYFDNLYDEQRAVLVKRQTDDSTSVAIYAKDTTLLGVNSAWGWYASVEADLFNAVKASLAVQDMYGKDLTTGKSIWASAWADPKIIPRIREIGISYSQTNVPYISYKKLRTPSAFVEGRAVYELSDNTSLVARYSERYTDVNGDGEIKGEREVKRSSGFGLEFRF
jgi:hypothetical protein